MILVIDTSSARSAVALVEDGRLVAESVKPSGREYDVGSEVAALVPELRWLAGVAVALGPGSFTGLRQGISYGLGLAMGLAAPLYGLRTLELQAARAPRPAIGVSDAGRGRVYFLAPDGRTGLTEPPGLPKEWPAVGWLKTAGVELLPEAGLLPFGEAAARLVRTAREVGYGTVSPEYMQSFGGLL